MLCPRHDSQLIPRTPLNPTEFSVHYLFCPNCHGHWLSAFDANYISSLDLSDDTLAGCNPVGNFICPQCRKSLERTAGDNVPPDVLAYHCPDNHGYFFPAGELKKFKEAQEVKLSYHKQWHVPLSSVASAMLMTLFGLLVSVGLVTGTLEGKRQESARVQAEGIISTHRYYVDQSTNSVTIIALTIEPVSLTLVVDGVDYPMIGPDLQSHVFRLTGLSAGMHQYGFRFTKNNTVITTKPEQFSF